MAVWPSRPLGMAAGLETASKHGLETTFFEARLD
jgi:hypothetical protein